MRVYRVENESGDGPYHWGVSDEDGVNIGSAHTDPQHPGPSEDDLLEAVYGSISPFDETEHEDKVFGMVSEESLLIWFDGWWEILEGHGHSITEWEVPEEYVAIGTSREQVVFMRSKAEKLGEW